jgi:hypothetical protein
MPAAAQARRKATGGGAKVEGVGMEHRFPAGSDAVSVHVSSGERCLHVHGGGPYLHGQRRKGRERRGEEE